MNNETEMSSVTEQIWLLNRKWMNTIFSKYTFVDAVGDDAHGGWKYLFTNCVFNSKLKSFETCGENGGKVKSGAACRRKSRKDGRCCMHPYMDVVISFDGNDSKIRPFPCNVAWDSVQIVADGTVVHVETPCEYLENFYSATHVWNDALSVAFKELDLKPSSSVVFNNKVYGVFPLWSTNHLLTLFPTATCLNNKKLLPGYSLEDYGVCNAQTENILK